MSMIDREDGVLLIEEEVNDWLNPEVEHPASDFHGVRLYYGRMSVGFDAKIDTVTAIPTDALVELRGIDSVEPETGNYLAVHDLAALTNDDYPDYPLTIDEEKPEFKIGACTKALEALDVLKARLNEITPGDEHEFRTSLEQDAILGIGGIIHRRAAERAHQLVNDLNKQIALIKTNKPWVIAKTPEGPITGRLIAFEAKSERNHPAIRPIVLTASHERAYLPINSTLGPDWLVFEYKEYVEPDNK
ncbi:MAG: hypothetical protein V4611_00605 [Patescibacteria group bacterium]